MPTARHFVALSILLIALLTTLPGTPAASAAPATPAAGAGGPQATFDSLFGAEAKKAQASADKRDQVAFAVKLLRSAESVPDDPGLQALLFEKAYDFAQADASGYEIARRAMDELAAAQPKQKPACDQKVLDLLDKQYRSAIVPSRKAAAAAYVVKAVELAEQKASAGALDEAAAVYRRAAPAAAMLGPQERADLQHRAAAVDAKIATRGRVTELTNKLRSHPDDRKMAAELVTVLLTEADDPTAAAKYVKATADPALQRIVALSAKPPAELSDAEAADLGDWFKAKAGEAGREAGKAAAQARARACYARFLEAYPKEDARRLKVKLALEELGPGPAATAQSPAAPEAGAGTATAGGAGTTHEPSRLRVVDLMPMIDPEVSSFEGVFKRDAGDLVSEGAAHARVRIPYDPPEEFDLHLEFTRTAGESPVSAFWSSSGRPRICDIGAAAAGLETGRRHAAVLRVRRESVSLLLDNKPAGAWKPDAAELSADAVSSVGPGAVGVGGHDSPLRFHRIELAEVTGKGRPAPRGDLDAKDWAVLTRDDRTGRWSDAPKGQVTVSVKDGVLEARNPAGHGRAILRYARQRADANLAASFVWSGGSDITLRAASGADQGVAYHVPDRHWHAGRLRRSDGGVGLFIDGQQAPLAAVGVPDEAEVYLSFELAPGDSVQIRHAAVTVPERR